MLATGARWYIVVLALIGCSSDGYDIAVVLPSSVSDRVTRIRVRVLRDCQTNSVISDKDFTFNKTVDDRPKLGALEPGAYGIEVTGYDGGVQDGGTCVPRVEVCNERDDDCDRRIDENIDDESDAGICGKCDSACCVDGGCEAPSPVVQITPSGEHTCARLANGKVLCWGGNNVGQLGNGTIVDSLVPVPVLQLMDAVEIDSGTSHTCALRATGEVTCWGDNSFSQLAERAGGSRNTPVVVQGVSSVRSLALGRDHSCVVTEAGSVWCWGWNGDAQLGRPVRGERDVQPIPISVAGVGNVEQADGGASFTCARHANGTVSCWGSDEQGELGNGPRSSGPNPSLVATSSGEPIQNVIALATGSFHACVLQQGATQGEGAVLCWGDNTYGTAGNGTISTTAAVTLVPTAVTDVVEVVSGLSFSCVRRVSGAVQCWGWNELGQLGDGTESTRLMPTQVSGLNDAAALHVGSALLHACAIRNNGQVVCWGYNHSGQLGIGRTSLDPHLTPETVQGL